MLQLGIQEEDIFYNLYVEKSNGQFSQIDLVILTKVGVIVIEVKNYSGWIYGNGNQRQWTKVLAYGKEKYRFYNPIMQNKSHILALRKKFRQFQNVPFYSLIVFYGNCELKAINFIPKEVFIVKSSKISNVIENIINNNKVIEFNKKQVIQLLRQYMGNGANKEIQHQYIKNIRLLLEKK